MSPPASLPPGVVPALLSALHLLGLGIGLAAVYARGRALRGAVDVPAVLRADNWWGVAAILWWSTGLLRAFGGYEKGTAFYLGSPFFLAKMAVLGLLVLLELWPMVTFIRWRVLQARGRPLDLSGARRLRVINSIEVALTALMPLLASLMARGVGR